MPTLAEHKKQFIKVFDGLSNDHERFSLFSDFLEMAVCAISKTTIPNGQEKQAQEIEDQYMAVVHRNNKKDIYEMPKLLAIAASAVQNGGCDFLGEVVGDMGLLDSRMGKFFTPYDVSRMMAEMTFQDIKHKISEQGFVTVSEPACGAGCMILAVADVVQSQGIHVEHRLYIDAVDISPLCFRMTYLQASLRGIPATIRRGNTLSLEIFEHVHTPAFLPFYNMHKHRFDRWMHGKRERKFVARRTRKVI